MKIGLLTYHHVTNYGSLLQAFALYKTIQQQGYEVELIDYRPLKAVRHYSQALLPIRSGKERLYLNRSFFANAIKAWKMRRFLISKMTLSRSKCYSQVGLKQFDRLYDTVVCGSDQIWDVNSFFRGYDSAYFLDFVDPANSHKVSYAASFGSTRTLGEYQTEVTELMRQFDTVLVRDRNTQALLDRECGIPSTKVLDPTLLINYDDLASPPELSQKYLLIYYQGYIPPEQAALIRAIAKLKNLTIVSIGYAHTVANQNRVGIGIEEWLGYFQKASYVITDTFHGTIFSIIFNRPFSVLVNPDKSLKVMDLLGDLGLEERAILNVETVSSLEEKTSAIDYIPVKKRLDQRVAESIAHLATALRGKYSNPK